MTELNQPIESRSKIAGSFGLPQRRAVRSAIAATVAFYLGWLVIDDDVLAVFATLSVIGLLTLADFSGDLHKQARAYVLATAIGAALVALGTLVSQDTYAAAGLLFVVALSVSLLTAMGRNVATGANGVLLFFLVACAVPSPASGLDSRVLGVVLGGAISLVAALTIWPRRPTDRLRAALADAIAALAARIGALEEPHEELEPFAEPVRDALADAGPERLAVGERPTLASERDQARMRVGYGLSRAHLLVERLAHRPASLPGVAEAEHALAHDLQDLLIATSAALRGEGPAPPVEAAADAGRAHRERTDAALVDELRFGSDDDALAVGADRGVLAGEIATSVGGIVTDVRVVVGADRFPARAGSISEGLDRRVEGILDRVVTLTSSTLSPRSVAFQNALRLAVGLALARLLGGLLQVENGFWVLFATLSVLRTNALQTGATAIQAVLGTAIGFAVALPLLLLIGTRGDLYLYVLPVAAVGGLLAGSINVVWGQAGFTVLVSVLFNLVEPVGWEIGIVRIQDVALGAAAGVVIGLAAWPRGAGGQLAQSLADAIRASGNLVAATVERRLRPVAPQRLSRLRSRARSVTLRAEGVLAVFLTEGPKNADDVDLWEQMTVFVHTRWYGAEMLARQSVAPPPPEAANLVDALLRRIGELADAHTAVADAIEGSEAPPPVRAPIELERLGRRATDLVARSAVDDRWAARGVVDILRTRALIAEITISLLRMRELVAERTGSSAEPKPAGAVAAATS
ncbi:MAG TPA: FUSC family protein [Solirubrobacteraceae bacterium]